MKKRNKKLSGDKRKAKSSSQKGRSTKKAWKGHKRICLDCSTKTYLTTSEAKSKFKKRCMECGGTLDRLNNYFGEK